MPVPSPYALLLSNVMVREASVSVLDSSTSYWDYGPPNADTVVVAVHGFRGEHHGLDPVVAHLSGIRVISPDLPGFGESEPLRDLTHDIAGYTAWLRAFIEALGLHAPVILGHSFGSIVVSAAVAGGVEASKVILVNPIAAPALSGPNGFLSRLTLLYYRAGRALPPKLGGALLSNWLIVRFMSLLLAQSPDRDLRRWVHDQHHTYFSRYATRDSVVEGFEASISADVSQFAPSITAPTLLIGADRDPITTVDAQRRLVELFPDARLEIIPAVGHLIHYEKPREAASAIVEFLGDGAVAVSEAAA
ncbi:pimeloyl-ACP methyl ester carboxylesterase [Microbacteriaceae bacterium SG_E_30_P1]|uniref:Pimeloyl-ACP methyl ester carboxylesterase n=1 Tax=Antiquaquibacter oligotrophicus TaxID=2880260 RepID=A0ABT6KLK0_9MICO|nr:alpha/beta hydrolase [Antiquaquibacter oligotrophicus]MDH6180900.1 pimeloyl-ACP methyl ester carboxylesterase [Antiquaquibacter oligotrophicus]UDF13394.1 alpha/beta hydrolase [Antiquaquibacter oligotrophicus]